MVQLHNWSLAIAPGSMSFATHDVALRSHLRIEQFRHRVSLALASNALDPAEFMSTRERLSSYRLLNAVFSDLEREVINLSPERNLILIQNVHLPLTWILTKNAAITHIYLTAACLHFHAFYLFDESTIDGYTDRIVTVYQTAYSFVEESLEMDRQENGFFHYCPFFCYQMFVCASFIVLKIMMNSYFESLLDVDAGKKLLNGAISALRKMSVANNDLPARLSDVIGFFFSLPDHRLISGQTIDSLRLRVRNRLSMSIVYDSLWEWRKHFQTSQGSDDGGTNTLDKYPAAPRFDPHLLTRINLLRSVFTPDGFQSTLAFDHLGGLADTFSFDWADDILNVQ